LFREKRPVAKLKKHKKVQQRIKRAFLGMKVLIKVAFCLFEKPKKSKYFPESSIFGSFSLKRENKILKMQKK